MKNKKILITVILISVFFVLAFLLPQFNQNNTIDTSGDGAIEDLKYPEKIWTNTPAAEVYITLNCDFSKDLEEMVEKSEIIVKGKFFNDLNKSAYYGERFITTKQTDKEIGTYSENLEFLGSKSGYSKFIVNEVFKGNVDNKIYVETAISSSFKCGDYYINTTSPLTTRVDIGEECILFLNYNKNEDCYEYSTHPCFVLIVKDTVKLKSGLISMKDDFSRFAVMKNDDLIKINFIAEKFNDTITGMKTEDFINKLKGCLK